MQWLEKECTAEDAGEAFRSPDDNYLSEPDNVSPQAWEQLLADFEQVDTDWRNFISTLSDEDLDRPYTPADGKYTWYAVIHGLMHHDNYHFGQIIMLKKCPMNVYFIDAFTDHVFGGNTAAVVPCRNG